MLLGSRLHPARGRACVLSMESEEDLGTLLAAELSEMGDELCGWFAEGAAEQERVVGVDPEVALVVQKTW